MPVHIDTLNMIVRRLSNQMPTRYYLCAGPCDNPYSHMRLELWRLVYSSFEGLEKELKGFGFEKEQEDHAANTDDGAAYMIQTWIAERDWTEKPHA